MTKRALLVRAAVALTAGVLGVLFLWSLGPLQWPTVAAYTGLMVLLTGLAGVVWPPRWLTVTRKESCGALLVGAATFGAALLWPVQTRQAANGSRLDAFLPAYEFHEFHEMRVHSSPEKAMAAVRTMTFADIGVMQTLGRIRSVAMGHRVEASRPAPPQKPMLDVIASGLTAFFPLENTDHEFIFGMAGQPWNNAARPVKLTPESFASWMQPGNVKIAANVRVEDAGSGWSRVITETRVLSTDDASRRTMASYWRLIYPGSAMIRQSMLNAIRTRSEL